MDSSQLDPQINMVKNVSGYILAKSSVNHSGSGSKGRSRVASRLSRVFSSRHVIIASLIIYIQGSVLFHFILIPVIEIFDYICSKWFRGSSTELS
jgi:uncharacterized membrane protein YdcZ (DUF606 family)